MASLAPNTRYEEMSQPTEGGKDIIAVGFRECRFPIGERDGTTMFCAHKTAVGETYCTEHYGKMYQPKKAVASQRPFIMPK